VAGATTDPRILVMIDELLRHAKALGACGAGQAVLTAAVPEPTAGVVVAAGAAEVSSALVELLATHRVWDR
jgi:catalase